VRPDLAMTGEVTLSGRVLPVGGIKEKVLAAKRVGITEVILPRQNRKNIVEDLTPTQRQDLTVHYVDDMHEVLTLALAPSGSQATKPAAAPRQDEARQRLSLA
jgi:ATP-dependent Lon protease